ncbi:hypothetical protein UR09_03335 [Candidatus Nitromaritima sp. SCGC AAA799-A02]|nr:hypothetical protein UR09_03335 [Candidatus Nitromaritima sp. SCGC AAA799-A02]
MFVFILLWPFHGQSEEYRRLTRVEFIESLVQEEPENPLFSGGSKQVSRETIYWQTSKRLKELGISALEGKSPNKPITDLEFIRVAYAFSGGSPGKSLLDQKRFLKKTGFVSQDDIGLATRVQGSVLQIHEGSSQNQVVRTASSLFMNDRVQTGRKSRAAFILEDKSSLTVSSNSIIKVTKSIYDPQKRLRQTVIHLSKGMARFAVTKIRGEGSSFTVVTPRGIAGVRGTEFVAMVDSKGAVRFVVIEGKIETAPTLPNGSIGKGTMVGAGQMIDIFKKGKVSRVKRVSPKLMKKIRKQTTVKPESHPKDLSRHRARMASIQSKPKKTYRTLKAKNKMPEGPLPVWDKDLQKDSKSVLDGVDGIRGHNLPTQEALRETSRLQTMKTLGGTRWSHQRAIKKALHSHRLSNRVNSDLGK